MKTHKCVPFLPIDSRFFMPLFFVSLLSACDLSSLGQSGATSTSGGVTASAPTPPVTVVPTPFDSLQVSVVSVREIDLSWVADQKAISYSVHRYPSGDSTHTTYPDRKIADLLKNTLSYKDMAFDNPKAANDGSDDVMFDGSGFRANWRYAYYVVANYADGTQNTSSPQVGSAPSGGGTVPPAVTELKLSSAAISSTEIDLVWECGNAVSYKLERKSTHGNDAFAPLTLTSPNALTYADKTINANWEYDYRLSALDKLGALIGTPLVLSVQAAAANTATGGTASGGSSSAIPGGDPTVSDRYFPSGIYFGNGSGMPKGCTNYNVDSTHTLQSAINQAPAAGTICFAPGNYSYSSFTLRTGLHYIGNGARVSGSGGELFKISSNGDQSEITGFVFTGAPLHFDGNPTVNVHDNLFGAGGGILASSIHDSHIDHNSFMGSGGVMLYPSNNNTTDYNRFDSVVEPIHAVGLNGTGQSFSYNVITHVSRHGIELQGSIWQFKCDHNWMSDWNRNNDGSANDSHMAISAPTGEGGDSEVAYNVLIQNGPNQSDSLWAKAWLEIAHAPGHPFSVHNNYAWDWNGLSLNNSSHEYSSSDNILVGAGTLPGASSSSRDVFYGISDTNAPLWPQAPQGVSPIKH